MSVNTCLIYRCLSSASAFIGSWFIYELQKSTTIAFQETHSTLSTSEIPPVEFCHAFGFQIVNTPPCPQNSIIVNPASPSEILKAVRGILWIFSGIAHYACRIAKMNLKSTTTNGFNFPIIISKLEYWWVRLTWLDSKNVNCCRILRGKAGFFVKYL